MPVIDCPDRRERARDGPDTGSRTRSAGNSASVCEPCEDSPAGHEAEVPVASGLAAKVCGSCFPFR